MQSGESKTNECLDFESDSSWEDVEEEDTTLLDDANACHPLLLNSLILEKIFEFLPIQSLLMCRLVNREWNRTVLLRKLLGSKFEITVSKGNFDRLLKTAQNSAQPFCRRFDFRLVELEYDRVSKFIRLFGDRLNCLSVKFCTASSAESVIKLLNCPRLEELKIYGALPEIKEESFHSFVFTRLRALSLHSSLDYGQVNKTFIKIILQHAPNLNSIHIGQSISLWLDFCSVNSTAASTKLCHVGLSGIEGALEIESFPNYFTLEQVSFQNCLVRPDFLEPFLLQNCKNLTALIVDGTQQEILSVAFREILLPSLKMLTLPIDGISVSDGGYLLQSCPRLTTLNVNGLFQTCFAFRDGRLLSVTFSEKYFSTLFSRDNLQNVIVHEKRREFLKALSLIHLQPQKLEINLPKSLIDSRCIRAIYTKFPDLEHLILMNNSASACIVGLSGIPYRICRRMAYCRSFSVLHSQRVRVFPNVSSLTKLQKLELTISDDVPPTAELTLLLVVYGICGSRNLQELILNKLTMSDVAFMILAQKLSLLSCRVNGSEDLWTEFQAFYKKHTIKSFLLPPPFDALSSCSPAEVVGRDSKILARIFGCMESCDIFEARKVCKYWHSVTLEYLHHRCTNDICLTTDLEAKLSRQQSNDDKACPASPNNSGLYHLGINQVAAFSKVQQVWKSMEKETSLAIISLNKATMEFFQVENFQLRGNMTCHKRRQLEYWYYPDGNDESIYRPDKQKCINKISEKAFFELDTLLVIGCWGRKDIGLLNFLNPSWTVSSVHLIGLGKEALDIVLPKLTLMMNLESLEIKPLLCSSSLCELTKTHLQILCNASFKLKQLSMQFHAPSDAVVEFVRSQRFTVETVELHSNVNVSDRLTFSMPQLKVLKLDEPPGCLLWTMLNVHSSLESINFGRSGCAYNQVKNKSSPKRDPVDTDFEHSATEILCDVNWFLENANTSRRLGCAQKSILQQGADSALKFFTHFPFLSSLTLRSVHAHYGILQGIFKNSPNSRSWN